MFSGEALSHETYPWTNAGIVPKPNRPAEVFLDASTFLIDYSLFGPSAFGIGAEPAEVIDLAMTMRMFQC